MLLFHFSLYTPPIQTISQCVLPLSGCVETVRCAHTSIIEEQDDRTEYIMAVPKSKITRMKRGHRRSTDALKNPTYVEDKNSGELRRPHHIDLKTGMYRGRQILEAKDSV